MKSISLKINLYIVPTFLSNTKYSTSSKTKFWRYHDPVPIEVLHYEYSDIRSIFPALNIGRLAKFHEYFSSVSISYDIEVPDVILLRVSLHHDELGDSFDGISKYHLDEVLVHLIHFSNKLVSNSIFVRKSNYSVREIVR